MRKIHFKKVGDYKLIPFDKITENNFLIFLISLSLILILIGTLGIYQFENPKINKWFSVIGFSLQIVYFGRIFLYRNLVQWNKKGILIRIRSFLGRSFKFQEIECTEMNDNKLSITKINGAKTTINLKGFDQCNIQKLKDIIEENTNTN